jgi:hypothetical protein
MYRARANEPEQGDGHSNLELPQLLCVHHDQRDVRDPAATIDMADASSILRQTNVASVEDIRHPITTGFEFQFAGKEDCEIVDNLGMPIDEAVLPTHKPQTGDRTGGAPFVRRSRK